MTSSSNSTNAIAGIRPDQNLNQIFQEMFNRGKLFPRYRHKMYLSPTVGAYRMYDKLIYDVMMNDWQRNRIYKAAIEQAVKDKIVVDVGTGKDVLLAKVCADAGAKKIYAIERNAKAYQLATAYVKRLGLSDKIILVYGDATEINLPELADVCVSELLGTIGGCEGVAVILNIARKFLKPDGIMIPYRSITHIAAVGFPEEILNNPGFSKVSWSYAKRIFEEIGYPFDLRVCIRHFPSSDLISSIGIFEDLDFTQPLPTEYSEKINLTITKDGKFDGFLLWLKLYTNESEVVDVLEDHTSNWLPVYLPLFDPGIAVAAGDRIEAVCEGKLSDDGVNPDYKITGHLIKQNGEIVAFERESNHHAKVFRSTPFYQRLFAEDGIKIIDDGSPQNFIQHVRVYLRENLPHPILDKVRKLRRWIDK